MDREHGNGTAPVERDANARLIAAAPDLLRACKHMRDDLIALADAHQHGVKPCSVDTGEVAIAKAGSSYL